MQAEKEKQLDMDQVDAVETGEERLRDEQIKEGQAVEERADQRELAARGYSPGPADGQMREQTGSAISAYEQDQGLTVTGKPTDELLRRIPLFRRVTPDDRARIVAVAGSADAASRMVAVTAEALNPSPELRPGAFAEVTIPVGSSATATVAPETAIRPSEKGFLAYVVRDGVAEERILTLGLRTADGMVEVKSGLAAEDSLVIRGAEALRNGAKVRVVTGSEDAAPSRGAP